MRRSAASRDRVTLDREHCQPPLVRKKHRRDRYARRRKRADVTRNMKKRHGAMRTNTTAYAPQWKIRAATALTAAGLAGFALAQGCDRPSTTSPEPPGGGKTYVLDFAVFESQVDPVLTAHGCDDLNCHGGGIRGTFELSPFDDKDVSFDFAQSRLQVNGADPAASSLLMKPLAEAVGGAAHGGGEAFASTDDTDYLALLAWIEAGEYR